MPRITREPVTAYAHCAQQLGHDGALAYDLNGAPQGEDRCPGYAQVEVAAIKETVAWTFGDFNVGSSDPMDTALAHNVSHSHDRVMWADLEDRACPYCGCDREISDQVRPVYAPLAGVRGSADQIFADRRERREQGQAMNRSADAATRQADALEEANILKARELDIRERELEAREPARRKPVKAEA